MANAIPILGKFSNLDKGNQFNVTNKLKNKIKEAAEKAQKDCEIIFLPRIKGNNKNN